MKILSSLRAKLFLPMLLGSLLVAVVVALSAYWIAAARAQAESRARLISITKVFSESSFPLTQNVMQMLAGLTDAYWVKLSSEERVLEFAAPTVASVNSGFRPFSRMDLENAKLVHSDSGDVRVEIGNRVYSAVLLKDQGRRMAVASDHRYDLLVMLDDTRRQQAVIQAALPPLMTGLATILLLGLLSLLLAERLIKRIGGLQREVNRIAAGDFELPLSDENQDEIDRLADAMRAMSQRLDQMWTALRRNHAQQLINQIASGLAHNLRNTLTGARLAVELIAQGPAPGKLCQFDSSGFAPRPDQSSALKIAIEQIQVAEQYIQRLLWMAKGRESEPAKPMLILECLNSLKAGLESTAAHRSVKIDWQLDCSLDRLEVSNGAALMSAVSNLVWNAMEAAKHVQIMARYRKESDICTIEVIDDGPGPPLEIQQSMFEPFVSSRPEGIGLGLPLVRQAAELLEGSVQWSHQDSRTAFNLQFPAVHRAEKS